MSWTGTLWNAVLVEWLTVQLQETWLLAGHICRLSDEAYCVLSDVLAESGLYVILKSNAYGAVLANTTFCVVCACLTFWRRNFFKF
jgi:hypothetical protein